MPAISRSRGWPPTRPGAAKEDAGTITPNLADWPAIEGPDIGQQSGVGMEIGVYDRQVRVESQFALGIERARDQEIQPDGRIRI